MTLTRPPRPAPRGPGRAPLGPAALVGLLAVAVALGVAQLVAGWIRPTSTPVTAVAAVVVDLSPRWLTEFGIRTFGSADKAVLLATVVGLLAVAAVGTGVLALRRRRSGLLSLVGFAAVGIAAVLSRPAAAPIDALPTLAGSAAGALALSVLVPAAVPAPAAGRRLDRRRFLATAGGAALVAAATGGVGELVGRTPARTAARIPAPTDPAPPRPPGTELGVAGITPWVTANPHFYRVDTALTVPRVDVATWRLTVGGAVDRPATVTFDELVARPLVERDITLNCVSNTVGGQYAGTARWVGVPLAPLLAEAGVRPGQDQLIGRSVDGMTIGTPLAAVRDGRDALLAVAMNGEPLPPEHGYPVRMLVPGLYGYAGACKWLTGLEVTRFDAVDAYWVQRGWAADGPVKTASRIDTPRPFTRLTAGTVAVAGVAWAQTRGIARVEVRVDGGDWQRTRLADGPTPDTWRQWVLPWRATPGDHVLEVRATDGRGDIQTHVRAEPFPGGASGWHTVTVTVE